MQPHLASVRDIEVRHEAGTGRRIMLGNYQEFIRPAFFQNPGDLRIRQMLQHLANEAQVARRKFIFDKVYALEIDGFAAKGLEDEDEIAKRKSFLRAIGYKL